MAYIKDRWVIVTGILASLLACVPLLNFRRVFYIDWNNHLWVIEYFGESIRHLSVPVIMNTKELVGLPIVIFYAHKFYMLAGVVSAFLGSAITIRLMIVAAFLLQFSHIYRTATRIGAEKFVATSVAVLVTWAIYPLTNLYNRCALTEFFAVIFLTCALMCFLSIILSPQKSTYDGVALGLFFTAAAVTHPLTALFGGLFLAVLGVVFLVFGPASQRSWYFKFFAATSVLCLLILSPWIYLVSQFNAKLPISSPTNNRVYLHSQYFFPQSLDNFFIRLWPWPLPIHDPRVTTPFLDTQITLPLLILIVVFIYVAKSKFQAWKSYHKAIAGTAALLLMAFFIESVCPSFFDWLGGFFNVLQFPYRLVTYVNLSALVVLIILAASLKESINQPVVKISLVFCLGLSLIGVMVKLHHAKAMAQKSTAIAQEIWAPLPWGSTRQLTHLPTTYYGVAAYAVSEGMAKVPAQPLPVNFLNFNVEDGIHFGQVDDARFDLKQKSLVVTNVQTFPWNKLVVNGALLNVQDTIAVASCEAMILPTGSYTVQAVSRIDSTWSMLNDLSWILLIIWVGLYLFVVWKERLKWGMFI